MIPQRTCVACDMSKPWRDMANWTKDKELEQRWIHALTPNDDEKRILELRLEAQRADGKGVYLCESHFNRERAFKLTSSGWEIRKNAVPEDMRKLFNDSTSQNAPSSSNNDMPPPSPLTQPKTPDSRKRPASVTLKNALEDVMPPPAKIPPPPPNTIDITGITTNMESNEGTTEGGTEVTGGAGEGGTDTGIPEGGPSTVGATVKIEEIEDDPNITWVNSVIPLETAVEAELRAQEKRAQEEAAAAAALAALAAAADPIDTIEDCIDSVIRKSLEPPPQIQSNLLKPNLSYETLCFEAFEFIEQNFEQTSLKMSDICHYISHKYRYFASGIMWRKQVFRALNTADYINVVRLDKPENKEDDSLYSLNKVEYDIRYGQDGEVRVRWRKKNKNPVQQQPNPSVVDEERRRMNNRAIPEASDDVALFNAIAGSLGVPTMD